MKLCWNFVIFLTLYVRIYICVPQLVPNPIIWTSDNELNIGQRVKNGEMDEKDASSKEQKGIALKEHQMSKSRQLETIAFPVGIAIGAIGAALWPTIFPRNSNNPTTTTTTTTTTTAPTTTTTQRSNDYDDFLIVEVDSSSITTAKTTSTTTTTTSTTTTTTTSLPATTTTTTTSTTTTTTNTTTTTTTTTITTTITTSGPRSVLSDFPDCGVKGTSNRVIGGTDVAENEYPWLCSLKYNDYHLCGMTLLSGPPHDTILVGAAHCFTAGDNAENYRITCGEHSLRARGKYEVTLQVTKVIIHPKYVEASTSGFDIAVYKVNEAPLNGKMVRKKLWPACLPDIDRDYMRETTYVAGWGITKNKYIQGTKIAVKGIPDIARHADVTVTECRDLENSRFPMGLVCAAESGRDSCQGDSGGPIVGTAFKYSNSTQKRLSWIGIVSYGIGCAEPGYPGAYTRSSCFLGFVAEQFGLKADFPSANEHPGWSTDCPNGASRRSSSIKRRKHKKWNKGKIKTTR